MSTWCRSARITPATTVKVDPPLQGGDTCISSLAPGEIEAGRAAITTRSTCTSAPSTMLPGDKLHRIGRVEPAAS
jgi:hypothetical protein